MLINSSRYRKKISISLLSANFLNLDSEIKKINNSSVDYIHLDVMDGHFVPNLTFGYELIKLIRKKTKKILDAHLMISNPEKHINEYINCNVDILGIHREINFDVIRLLKKIRRAKIKPCLVFNPKTSISNIDFFFPYVSQILLMSVKPGFAGQKFIKKTLQRGKEVFKKINNSNYEIDLEIDGGVNNENITKIKKSGFNVFVSGSYLFQGKNLEKKISSLR